MIDITLLEQYFPTVNKPIEIDKYVFWVIFQQTESTFVINLKIKQKSIPGEHLIKFRFGIGQDEPKKDASHETDKPHFEIETYKRGDETISTTVYFTFENVADEQVVNYAKGTVIMIEKIIQSFLEKNKLSLGLINEIIYSNIVLNDLKGFDIKLISALVESFESGNLILRDGHTVIKTPYKLKQCLSAPELQPLLLPILEKIKKN
jgi:hypothetical protein